MSPDERELTGKVAIVTGAAAGIGAGIATALAEAGAAVAVADVDDAGADIVTRTINDKGGRAVAVPVDVTVSSSVIDMVRETIACLGTVDILVNNAGIATTGLVD